MNRLIIAVALAFAVLQARVQAQVPVRNPDAGVYLFSTFDGQKQDGLRFAFSHDGYHWTNVPGLFLKARVGGGIMRDPSLCRGPDGTWHLVWTTAWRGDKGIGYARSRDLVHWSEQEFVPVMAHEPETHNVWAPELFYDGAEQHFIICWSSTIPGRYAEGLEATNNNHRMYYTVTRDFRTFTPARLFLEPGYSVIDGQIVKRDGGYVLVFKDNTRPHLNLRVAFGDSPVGPWQDISAPLTAQFTEGPSVLKIGEDWVIFFEGYRSHQYGAIRTRDFRSFTDLKSDTVFPAGLKHGTAFRATQRELDYLFKVGTQQVAQVRLPWISPVSRERIESRLGEINAVATRGPFRPDWASITNGFKTPGWYEDAKFGLFIHWGVYSVPAFGSEWYPREMYVRGSKEFQHHLATYGPQSKFGYKDFIPRFTAERFDATAWAELFRDAGVKYVVPVAEHHDGFPMYASDMTEWSAARKGPGRDLIAEQAEAYRKAGIVFGASSHRAEHWFFFDNGMVFDSDVRDTNHAALYGPAVNKRMAEAQAEPPDKAFLDDWLLRSCEIVDRYRPEVFYFDWWICQPVFQPYLKTFAAYYYNRATEWGRQVAINFKEWEGTSFPRGAGVFDMERGQADDLQPGLWQTCTSVSRNSWGYVSNQDYKDTGEIVDDLVDIVSKNGTMLLNIGPRADGTIPGREQQMLREIGAWLKVNGEAIYGTRPWKQFGEGPTRLAGGSFSDKNKKPEFTAEDIRFTTKGGVLYAIALAWPKDGRLRIKSLVRPRARDDTGNASGAGAGGLEVSRNPQAGMSAPRLGVRRVALLGCADPLQWEQNEAGLLVILPSVPPSDHAVSLRIEMEGEENGG